MKICVYAISKNEEQFVDRFVDSAKDADLILIGDTGSTDGTLIKIQGRPEKNLACMRISINPWRFDMARNTVLSVIPPDFDVCVSLDLDEVLQPGWRKAIEDAWVPGTTRLRYLFNWGGPVEFYYEKIHARIGYKWHHPCHEYPVPYGIEEKWAQVDKLLVVHLPDPNKSRAQYLELLKWSVEEDPNCPRNAFYYGRELSFRSSWDESIKELDRYLALPRATWPNERSYAYRTKGQCYVGKGNLAEAEKQFLLAALETPNTREPWIELADLCYKQSRWPECYAYAMRALGLTIKEKVYTVDHAAWGPKPHLLASIGAWNIGLRSLALMQGQKCLEMAPDDPLFINNVKVMMEIMNPASAPTLKIKAPDGPIPNAKEVLARLETGSVSSPKKLSIAVSG